MKKTMWMIFLMSAITFRGWAQSINTRVQQFNTSQNGLAIEGYDPVAYFTTHKATEGKKNISMVYEGITYRFASEQNRNLFKANPTAYEPQYGGWCAYAMGATGEKVSIDPETFKVVNNKLYLFYNRFFNNTMKDWNKDEVNLKMKADRNWPLILNRKK